MMVREKTPKNPLALNRERVRTLRVKTALQTGMQAIDGGGNGGSGGGGGGPTGKTQQP